MVFKPIRLMSRPLYNSLASANQKNFFIRFLQVMCLPCIWLHHKLIRFLSKSGLIQMNMWGTNFNMSSKQSYYLVKVRHGERGQGNEDLIEFVLRQMKLSISLVGALLFYIYAAFIPYSPSIKNISDVADPFVGSLLVFAFSLFVSSAYTGTYDIIIKSVVHCNFMDEEMFVGEQKFTEPLFDELMGYWKKADDDDKLNAAAKQTKKKEALKEDIDFEDHYKQVPDGDEDDNNGPSSEEEKEGPTDMFTENKKARQNKEQDFDEDFLKKPAKVSLLEKPLAKSQRTDFEAEAVFEDPDEAERPPEIKVKTTHAQLDALQSDVSIEIDEPDQQKPAVVTINEGDKKDSPRDPPKPILKNSTRFIEDDNKSMKSSLSKKKKFGIKLENSEAKNEEHDENKSMKSMKSKLSSKSKMLKKPKTEQPELIQFKAPEEGQDEDVKRKNELSVNDKPKEADVKVQNKEDEGDNKSMKLSLKSKKLALSGKSISKSPQPKLGGGLAQKNESTPPVFNTEKNDDDDTKSKKSLKKSALKKPLANNSEVAPLKADDDDLDKKSAKLSIKTGKSSKTGKSVKLNVPNLDKKEEPKKGLDSSSSNVLLPKSNLTKKSNDLKFEDDDFANVVDKNQSIKILNASQGQSMLSQKSGKKNATNTSDFNFKLDDSDDEKRPDDYF